MKFQYYPVGFLFEVVTKSTLHFLVQDSKIKMTLSLWGMSLFQVI